MRDPKYDILFEPVKIGPKTTPNRFFQVPHCNGAGSGNPASQAKFRGMKAEGGWGVVCVEYSPIHPEADRAPYTGGDIYDEIDAENLGHTAREVQKHGSLAGIQLWYGGMQTPLLGSQAIPRGPAEMISPTYHYSYCYAADEDDIAELVGMYTDAARRAQAAGFDYIEVLGSDTATPLQFLMAQYNPRTDRYGGSLENRARFWIEVMTAIKSAVGDECAVGTRLASDHMIGPDGLELDEALEFVELMDREGVCDLWNITIACFAEWGNGFTTGPSRFYEAGDQGWAGQAIKGVAKAPVVGIGRLTSPDDMLEVIVSGKADFIGAARPSIADPFLPRKIEEGRPEDIRECIGCNMCISRWEQGAPLVCTQNATSMEEYRRGWHPEKFEKTADPCSVLVVGAGPAGLECARVLGLRGYDVHLREAAGEAGGHMRNVMRYPGLAEWGRVITYRQGQIDKLKNVELHTGVGEMTADDVLAYGAEKVVIAVGAQWRGDGVGGGSNLPIEGVDASRPEFCTPDQVMAGKEVGERVVVFDADGYIHGVGMAELLADRGKKVAIITPFAGVAPYTEYTLEAANLHRVMREKNVIRHPLHWVESVAAGNRLTVRMFDVYRDSSRVAMPPRSGEHPRARGSEVTEISCDSVVLATARSSKGALYNELKRRRVEWADNEIEAVYRVGDCHTPRFTQLAIFEGHRLAREFDSENPQQPLPYKRERARWDGVS